MCKDCGCGQTNSMRAHLKVKGMVCDHCKETVESALLSQPGVMAASVDLGKGEAQVDYNGDDMSVSTLRQAVEATGFDVEEEVQTEAIHEHHHHGIMGTIKKMFS